MIILAGLQNKMDHQCQCNWVAQFMLLIIKILTAILKLLKCALVIYILFIGITLEGKEVQSHFLKSYVF